MNVVSTNRPVSTWMLVACGVWLVGLGLYFIVLRPPLLPEDARFMGTTVAQIRTALPGLESWLEKVFTVMGGFIASAGVLTVFVATVAMPPRLKGTSWAIALSGALGVALMSATNFALYSDFRWLLLVPALAWLAGFVLYISARPADVVHPAWIGEEINLMNESSNTPLVIAFVVVVVLFLIFGGGAMSGAMMSGGMMGPGWIGGFNWMWIPTLLTLGLGVLLASMILGKK